MGYALRPGLHYCAIDDHLIFLDVVADRYFGLSDRASADFARLVAGDLSDPSDDAIAGLLDSRIIEPSAVDLLAPCPDVVRPEASALDISEYRPAPWRKVAALSALAIARAELKRKGLAASIEQLRQLKRADDCKRRSEPVLITEALAFAWTTRWVRSNDQCLPRSLALARRLASRGVDATLMIGVRLRPFAAHCWTQTSGLLLNDRYEQVRSYHPILIV
jgi:hypothetical protein